MTTKKTNEALDTGADNGTNAAATIKAKPTGASSKLGMMAQTLSAIGKMSPQDLSKWFNDSIAQIGHEADPIPDGTAEKNKATVAMKEATEAEFMEILKGDESLSEETREKMATLFVASLAAKSAILEAELQEAADQAITEAVEEIRAAAIEKLDEYTDIISKQWLEENQVAIDESLEVEILREFQQNLRTLFIESNIEIPEGKLDVMKELAERVKVAEDKLNEEIERTIEINKKLRAYEKKDLVSEASVGLTATGVEKMKTLSEGLDYDGDAEAFKKKLLVVKEQYFPGKAGDKTINENAALEDEKKPDAPRATDPTMSRYVQAISSSLFKG